MIYTVTFNPSLDYIVTVDQFAFGKTNRTSSEQLLPGGKGVNVLFFTVWESKTPLWDFWPDLQDVRLKKKSAAAA